MHYRHFEKPWYVQRSIDNNPLRNGSNLESTGLENIVEAAKSNNNQDDHKGLLGYVGSTLSKGLGYASPIAGNIFSIVPSPVKRFALAGSLAGLLYVAVACSSTPKLNLPVPDKQEHTLVQSGSLNEDITYRIIFRYREPSTPFGKKVLEEEGVITYMRLVRKEKDFEGSRLINSFPKNDPSKRSSWKASLEANLSNIDISEWKEIFERQKEGSLFPYLPLEDMKLMMQHGLDSGKALYFQQTATGEFMPMQNPDMSDEEYDQLTRKHMNEIIKARKEDGVKVAIYPWVPWDISHPRDPIITPTLTDDGRAHSEFVRLCSNLEIKCAELDFREKYFLADLAKFDVILFPTSLYKTRVPRLSWIPEDTPWIPEDIIKQYVKDGGKVYAMWLYGIKSKDWLPEELSINHDTDREMKPRILDPLHPILSRVLPLMQQTGIGLGTLWLPEVAIDVNNKWTYLLGSGNRAVLLEIPHGNGIYVLNIGYYDSFRKGIPTFDLIVEDTLLYLLSNEGLASSSEAQIASHQRSLAGRLTAQIEEVHNSPDLSGTQKRTEIERIIDAFKRGSQYPGSLEDKAIETLIEYASPDAVEDTRIIQSNAVQWIFETNDEKAEQHMDTIQDQIKKMFGDNK